MVVPVLIFVLLIANIEAKVDPSQVGVVGFSSGAYFAVQYQVAYSSSLLGAAIFAGGPYYCAQDNLLNAFTQCMSGLEPIDLPTLEGVANQFQSAGTIDKLSNLANHNVYIYSAELDTTVNPAVVKTLQKMYGDWNVTKVTTKYDILGAHTFPTLDYGNLCVISLEPYISKCDYDGAGAALQTIYGTLNPAGDAVESNVIPLPQGKFTPGGASPSSLSLDTTAYVYVPTACKNKDTTCKFAIVLHGCTQQFQEVGNKFILNAGFNSWAESNNIIIAYPQTITSLISPENAEGCWDWWGYLDANFANNQGKQMQFMKNLADFIIKNF